MSPKRYCPRILLLLAALTAIGGCSGPKKLEFPMEVPGGWKLAGKEQLTAANAAQQIQVQGLVSWWTATYTGPSYPTVNLYEMKTSADAFELVQKHRSTPGLIAMNIDRAFITIQTFRGTLPELNKFASAFEKVF